MLEKAATFNLAGGNLVSCALRITDMQMVINELGVEKFIWLCKAGGGVALLSADVDWETGGRVEG